MHKAPAGQFIILYILLILTGCGGKQKKEQSANAVIHSAKKDTVSKIKNAEPKVSETEIVGKAPSLICVSFPEANSFEPGELYRDYALNKKHYFKGKIRLSDEYVRQHLFADTAGAYLDSLWKHMQEGTMAKDNNIDNPAFYLLGTTIKKPLYVGILYEELGDDESAKYFSTMDKKGKFIARIQIADYSFAGTYPKDDGSKQGYYSGSDGCINKDLTITTAEAEFNGIRYKIQPDGKIVEYQFRKVYYDSLLKADPTNIQIRLNYARYLSDKYNDFVSAKAQFEKLLQIDPHNVDLNIDYAEFVSYRLNDTISAKRYYEKAIALAPNKSYLYEDYANFLSLTLNDKENARVLYQKAIALAPNGSMLQLNYAQFLVEKFHLVKEARQHYLQAIKLNPSLKDRSYDHIFHVK